MNSSRSNSTIN